MARRSRLDEKRPRTFLGKYSQEYEEEQKLKKQIGARKELKSINQLRKQNAYEDKHFVFEERQDRYNASNTGKFSNAVTHGFKIIQTPHGIARAIYNRGQPQMNTPNSGKGRPRGSFDNRYKQFGGVYGYRKFIAARNRQQQMQSYQNSQLSPEEQQLLMQLRAKNSQPSPESRTFPDTTGKFDFKQIWSNVDEASHLFP
jgi:hypothetical protein